jgi:WD40 repeat protein
VDDRLIASSLKGPVMLWDTNKGQLIQKYDHHKESVIRLAWCHLDPTLLASCSKDGFWYAPFSFYLLANVIVN